MYIDSVDELPAHRQILPFRRRDEGRRFSAHRLEVVFEHSQSVQGLHVSFLFGIYFKNFSGKVQKNEENNFLRKMIEKTTEKKRQIFFFSQKK